MTPTAFIYEHCDIPDGMTLADYRRRHCAARPCGRCRRAMAWLGAAIGLAA